jgi:serine O-acetyltransferase
VVLKPVPPGATVVGIPGHLIDPSARKGNAQRDAMAYRMGFDPYGAKADMPDPVANAINRMLDHIHAMDQQLENMKKSLNAAGIEYAEPPMPRLEGCEIEDSYEEKSEI